MSRRAAQPRREEVGEHCLSTKCELRSRANLVSSGGNPQGGEPGAAATRSAKLKEPLIKSSADCVAGKMRKDARRATKVVARTTKPRSATPQTPHFAATLRDGGFPGGLLCRSACQGDWPLAAPRFAHPIPECRRRNRAGLDQRFLKCGSGSISAPFNYASCGSLRPSPLHAARVRVRGAFFLVIFEKSHQLPGCPRQQTSKPALFLLSGSSPAVRRESASDRAIQTRPAA